MPWKESCRVHERMLFVVRLEKGERMSDLCREFGISRKTGYKIHARYKEQSVVGLYDQKRVPHLRHARRDVAVMLLRSEHFELARRVRMQRDTNGLRGSSTALSLRSHDAFVTSL